MQHLSDREVFIFPSSFAQRRIWFLAQLERQAGAYHLAKAFSVRGRLHPGALAGALDEVVARHEALRTTFMILDGDPVQVVDPAARSPLATLDLTGVAPPARAAELARILAEISSTPFDLVRGPLFRTLLVFLGPDRHVLAYVLHHIVGDAWSEGILLREVASLYAALTGGSPSPLPDLPLQYGDYAQWQRDTLQDEALHELLAYWTEELSGAPLALDLPTDRPRPATFTHRGDTVGGAWPQALSRSLPELARCEGVTLFTVLLAGLGMLLSRLAGQDQVLIGSPIANRRQVELEGVIGLFLDTLVFRVDLRGDPGFRELLARVREAAHGAQEHQDLPFEQLVSALGVERDPSRSPVFQAWLNLENLPEQEAAFGELELDLIPMSNRSIKFDLMLNVREVGSQIRAAFLYNEDLFDGVTIRRWIESLQAQLARAAAEPWRRVSELALAREAERHQLLVEWNDTFRPPAPPACLHQLFEAQASVAGDAVAAVAGERCLTYGELDEQADRLAGRLRRLGVVPGAPVAVFLRRSIDLMTALLGILKAGGAYVPIDPGYPAERIAFMLEDCGCRIVLTQAALEERLPQAGLEVLRVDDAVEEAGGCGGAKTEVQEDDLAFIIYTSGSTGRPKGVMVSHRGAVSYLRWCLEHYGVESGNGAPVHSSIGFDLSVTSLFAPLAAGQPVHLLAEGQGVEPLESALRRGHGFSFVKLTPSHLDLLRQDLPAGALPAVPRALLLGGETLFAQSLARWRAQAPATRLINEYGPTETVVGCCVHEVGETDGTSGDVSIGRPIARTWIHLLDPWGIPAPAGAVGEICVGGVQVTRGYLGRPDLTAERFIPDAWSGEPGARLYRTGDLARWTPDGRLRLLGRSDRQIKIQGFRIEPGEIETFLLAHPAVREAAVAAHGAPGDRRLVAYVVGASEPPPSAEELRRFLVDRLPEHMIPRLFVTLPALPLNAHGKVDRSALPEPGEARAGLAQPYVAPRDPVEDALAAIWSAVLRVDPVGVHDNFFVLGGDSIRSIQVVALARERGLRLTLQQVAMHPTIAEVALQIRERLADESGDEEIYTEPFSLISAEDRACLPAEVEDAYPLSGLQAGMLYHIEELPGTPVFHSINSFFLKLPFDPDKFQQAVAQVAARHANLRTAFELSACSEPLQLVYREPWFPVGWTDLRSLSESEQRRALEEYWNAEVRRPFDLSRAPQLRFHVHWRSDETLQFTLTENHAVIDGWSLHVVFSEIFSCYSALLRGEPPPALPPLRTTFRDFIALERRSLSSREHAGYWDRKLDGCAALRVPRWRESTDLPAGKRCLRQDLLLPLDLTAALRNLAQAEAVSLKSVFLAAHCKVMGLLGGTSDVLTGVSSNGRPETPDGQRICGLFLNTLPLRVGLGNGTWKDLIYAAHAEQLEMLPYRRYPLSEIQARRGRERLLETSFVYLNFHVMDDAVQAQGLQSAGGGRFVEETDFVIMTAFIHSLGLQDRIVLNLTCDLTVLEEEQIRRIEAYYLAALRAMAADPAARHDAAPLLSPAEMQVLTAEWSGAGKAAPESGTIHERFEAQVDRTPEAVCVESAGRSLTFREVDARANRLAHRLRGLGIGPEARIALWLERSADLVIALLGVLKAGGAYLPVDPAFPAERVRFLLQDAGVSAVVAAESWRDRVPAGPMLPVLSLEETADGETAERTRPTPGGGASAGHLAYVLYTSGSTGVPKGVGVEHRQLLAYLDGARERLDLPMGAVYAHMSTFSADLGNTVLFPPLCAGGTLRIVTEEQLRDPAALAEGFARRPVDCLKVVPSMLSALLEHPEGASILPRRRLILGGEVAGWKLIETVRRLAPQCRVFNHYGPTETTVGVVAGEVTGMESPAGETGPRLGRPLGSARAYVLGPDRQPVPAGVPGELFVGGAGVSRGYIGRPDLTAERFLPDPFAGEPGARSYRTGDVVRWTPAGELEFLGRRDHQVKIRGFRVEISEIESILRRHPAVRDAAAVAWHEGQDRSLAAYVVPVPGHAPLAGELRRFLAEHLPAYMVPAAFVELREFPLTPNGKLDRRALPAPGELRPQERAERPENPVQHQLFDLWGEVLGHRSFGIRDDFFEIGGNSLLAVRLVARLRKHFGRKLPLTALVEAGTVEKLARVLQAGAPAAPAAHLIPLQPGGERLPLFCVHPGHGSVSSYLKLAHYLGPDQPFYGLQARDLDRDGDPYLSVEELAARYLAEVIAARPQGPYLLAGWSFGGLVAFEMAQQLRRQGREVLGLALIDTRSPAANARLVGIEPDLMKAYLLVEHAKNLAKLSARDLPITPHDLLGLDLQEQLDRVLAAIDVRALLPEEMGTETIRRFLELRIARFQAIKNYVPAPYAGRITLFRAAEVYTDTALGEAARIFEEAARHPTYRWDEIALQPVDLRPVAGNHESIVYEPHVGKLAAEMRAFLDELMSSGADPENHLVLCGADGGA